MHGLRVNPPGVWLSTRASVARGSLQLRDRAAEEILYGLPLTGPGPLRIQILPDGRCGIAINQQVVWLSPEPIPLDGEFRLPLGDESAGLKLLHGPLEIWTGVRTDIDWSRR